MRHKWRVSLCHECRQPTVTCLTKADKTETGESQPGPVADSRYTPEEMAKITAMLGKDMSEAIGAFAARPCARYSPEDWVGESRLRQN